MPKIKTKGFTKPVKNTQVSQEAQNDPEFQKKAAEKAAKDQAAAEAKAKRDAEAAEKAKVQKQTEKELVPIAKEITVRLEKADKAEHDADDHRLAAALRFAEAENKCKAGGVPFKKWAEENIKLSFETVRKLLLVGRSGDEAKARLALEDMRAKNAANNRKARAKAKTSKASAGTPTPAGKAAPAKTPFKIADEALAALKDDVQVELIKSRAGKLGMAVVDKGAAKAGSKTSGTAAEVCAAFDKLPAGEMLEVVAHIEKKMNGTFKSNL